MRNMKFIVNVVLVVSSIGALAQESARTVQYHSQDIVPIGCVSTEPFLYCRR